VPPPRGWRRSGTRPVGGGVSSAGVRPEEGGEDVGGRSPGLWDGRVVAPGRSREKVRDDMS
jgi:hypothetical protein